MRKLMKGILLTMILLVGWYGLVKGLNIPHYLLPLPSDVWHSLNTQYALLWQHTQVTFIEIAVGLVLGVFFGLLSALILSFSASLRALLLPLLIVSQAIPVFAIAPLLVLWLGYGMASKIAMTVLIIYFPITAACYDGLRNTPKAYLELAKTLKIRPLAMLWRVRLPAALPALASGLRIAVSIAPIGAVIGEWVGSAEGLGYLMLQANARMQVDLMFAALFILLLLTLTLYFTTDSALKRYLPWISHLQ